MPDPRWGEAPIAAVVFREGVAISDEEMRDWINQNVEAKFQRVREVFRLVEFPRNAAGKTLKREIREHHQTREHEQERKKDVLPQ